MAKQTKLVKVKGQAMIEFVLSISVLILFVFGLFEVGMLFHKKIVLANSAREGVRYLIRHSSDADPEDPEAEPFDRTIAAITNEAKGYGIIVDPDNISITCIDKNGHNSDFEPGDTVTININEIIEIGIVSQLFGTINLEETAIMRMP